MGAGRQAKSGAVRAGLMALEIMRIITKKHPILDLVRRADRKSKFRDGGKLHVPPANGTPPEPEEMTRDFHDFYRHLFRRYATKPLKTPGSHL